MILNPMTKYGEVEGLPTASPGVSAFKGIPFAAPPVGKLRWREPQPPAPWDGVKKCYDYKPAAVQCKPSVPFYVDEFPIDYNRVEFSEDCLYLNLWTPARTTEDKLPVMMWIHGGGNEVGFPQEPEHDGEYLAQRGVIYVNAVYRLNVFGFLAHPELSKEQGGHSGNYGILDCVAVLRWIRDNIAAFGGDPDNVTIFGQSAGAMNVDTLVSAPMTRGLINRAISMSGNGAGSFVGGTTLAEAEEIGLEFMKTCSCKSLDELRALPAHMVFGYMKVFGRKAMSFSVIRDGWLLDKPFPEKVKNGEIADISYMVGCCSHEGAAFGMMGMRARTAEQFNAGLPRQYGANAELAKKLYGIETDAQAEAFSGDTMTDGSVYGVRLWGKLQNDLGRKPAYLYLFDRQVPDAEGNPAPTGSFHSSDLWYVHGTIHRSWRGMNEGDKKTSDAEMDYFTSFARTGDPNREGSGLPVWTPYTPDCRETMVLCEEPHMSDLKDNVGAQILNALYE